MTHNDKYDMIIVDMLDEDTADSLWRHESAIYDEDPPEENKYEELERMYEELEERESRVRY